MVLTNLDSSISGNRDRITRIKIVDMIMVLKEIQSDFSNEILCYQKLIGHYKTTETGVISSD